MFWVIIALIAGILTGFFFRNKDRFMELSELFSSWFIYVFLFTLGITVGISDEIMNNLGRIGFQAIIISLSAVLGSVIISAILAGRALKVGGNNEE